MKEASTFDGQLSPVCPWCGQARCQVWCNEVALEKSKVSRSCRRSTQQKTIADVLLKESWVAGYFFGCETATESFFGCGTVTDSFLVPKTVGLEQSTGTQQACSARHNIGEQSLCSKYVN